MEKAELIKEIGKVNYGSNALSRALDAGAYIGRDLCLLQAGIIAVKGLKHLLSEKGANLLSQTEKFVKNEIGEKELNFAIAEEFLFREGQNFTSTSECTADAARANVYLAQAAIEFSEYKLETAMEWAVKAGSRSIDEVNKLLSDTLK